MARTTKMISCFLDTNGDQTGTKDARGTYGSSPITPTEFFYESPSLTYSIINRMLISIGDESPMQAQEYGNLGSVLSNGFLILVKNATGATVVDLTDGEEIKTNADWGKYCFDVDIKSWGAGNELLVSRWTFGKSGTPIILEPGWTLGITFTDDFDELLSHHFMIQGYTSNERFRHSDI